MSNAKIILDTNIVSYMMKGGTLAEIYEPHLQRRVSAIAFITVGELYYGAEKANWGKENEDCWIILFAPLSLFHTIMKSLAAMAG